MVLIAEFEHDDERIEIEWSIHKENVVIDDLRARRQSVADGIDDDIIECWREAIGDAVFT